MARKILCDGLRAANPRTNEDAVHEAWLFVLGPSNRPHAAFAADVVLQIEVDGEQYLVPAAMVREMIDQATIKAERKRT